MRYFVEFVVSSLVQYAEEVEVQEEETPSSVTYTIYLNQADVGRVIGKKGRTIGAIRNLLNSVGSNTGKRVIIEVMDELSA
jgi:predicted RNA-binding protein YlqC (UPF0109 family)